MRIRIVSYEDVNSWILGKFALRLHEHLSKIGIRADIGNTPDRLADINHHIIFGHYDGKQNSIDTMMITHIDEQQKIDILRHQLLKAEMGICMSLDTMRMLVHNGVPRTKLCYVNPAHDGLLAPRKFIVGITSRIYGDGRKREELLAQLADRISPMDFKFRIMGAGWERILEHLKKRSIDFDYINHFEPGGYRELISSLDYYLYLGKDEGSMGFIDALAAGIPTIVTPQGFHLDVQDGITYRFSNICELEAIFSKIAQPRNQRAHSVSAWTWSTYACKHLQIWEYLLRRQTGQVGGPEVQKELGMVGIARYRRVAELQTLLFRCIRSSHKMRRKILSHFRTFLAHT